MTWETQAKLSSFKISPLVYSSEKRVHDSYFESGLFFQYFFKIMQLESMILMSFWAILPS